MSHIQADRIKETSTTTGTGSFELGGAVSKFKTFGSRMANGDTTYYCIEHQSADEWEVGFGTYVSATDDLARTTVLQSSNADAAVNFSAGTKHVFMTLPSIAAGFGALTVAPSASQNDYAPTGMNLASRLMVNPSNSIGISGLGGGHDTRRIIIHNVSTDYLLWLEHECTNSAAANRFKLLHAFPLFLMPNDWAEFVYHNSRWDYIGGSQVGAMGFPMFDDFGAAAGVAPNNGAVGLLGVTIAGTGSTAGNFSGSVDATNRPMGQISLDRGTTTTGRSALGMGGANGAGTVVPALGPALYAARVRLNAAVDGTNTFDVRVGWADGADGSQNHGVYWEYRWTGAAAEWSQTRMAATVATRVNTGSPTPDLNYNWWVIFCNAAWSRVDYIYSLDGMAFAVASSPTTGIPTNAQPVSPGVGIFGSAGTTGRAIVVDLVGWRYDHVRN